MAVVDKEVRTQGFSLKRRTKRDEMRFERVTGSLFSPCRTEKSSTQQAPYVTSPMMMVSTLAKLNVCVAQRFGSRDERREGG